MTEHSWHYDYQ